MGSQQSDVHMPKTGGAFLGDYYIYVICSLTFILNYYTLTKNHD